MPFTNNFVFHVSLFVRLFAVSMHPKSGFDWFLPLFCLSLTVFFAFSLYDCLQWVCTQHLVLLISSIILPFIDSLLCFLFVRLFAVSMHSTSGFDWFLPLFCLSLTVFFAFSLYDCLQWVCTQHLVLIDFFHYFAFHWQSSLLCLCTIVCSEYAPNIWFWLISSNVIPFITILFLFFFVCLIIWSEHVPDVWFQLISFSLISFANNLIFPFPLFAEGLRMQLKILWNKCKIRTQYLWGMRYSGYVHVPHVE